MSKRGAQGPQGDKDSDLFAFNMSSTPDEKPQRATAAQLANRKIKDVRRRRPNSSTPSTTGASFSGPFNSLDPNTVSSSSAAPQTASSSFTFGQSQSFPGASSNSSQPSQNGGGSPFSFGSGGASSSFNFSGGAQSSNSNPFATMNSGANQQPPSGGGQFSGFQGSMFNLPAAGSPAPAQQPLPSGGLFGNNSQQPSTSGGIFGNPASSAPSALSGGAATSGNLFGSTSATSSTPQPNLFGRSSPDKPSPFSQSSALEESMQTSPDAKNNASQSKPTLFGASAPSFGGSTSFGSPAAGTNSVFGAAPSTTAATPSKPLFGAGPTDSPSSSVFGAATQSTSASTPAASTPSTAPATSTLFGSTSAAKPTTPFANLFGGASTSSATPKAPEEKAAEEKNGEPAQSKPAFQFTPSSSTGPSLFQKSETSAAPASGIFQAPNTGSNPFAPKPAAAQEQEKSEPASPNPFQSLFSPKPATPGPTTSNTPATEQKPLPSAAPLGNLFGSKTSTPGGASQTSAPSAPATTAPLFSAPASSLNASASSPAPSLFSTSTGPKLQEPATASPVPAQSPFKPNGVSLSSPSVSTPASAKAPTPSFDQLQPSGLPGNLSQETKKETGTQYRIRMLNVSFQRKIAELDPSTDDFESIIGYYSRVRATLSPQVGAQKLKHKIEDGQNVAAEGPSSKKPRPDSTADLDTPTKATPSTPTATDAKSSNKRKSPEPEGDDGRPEKRVNGASTTANIFAQSFSKSKTSETDDDSAKASPATPAGASPVKAPSLFPTPSASSPAKPTFGSPAKTTENSTPSLFGSSASVSKPTFTAPTANATAAPNPFVLKPSGDKNADAASGPPKFNTGPTNFFAQFKAQADKTAEKEKAKRKAEDFDSDEDDEAEWERKDAEKQRQKREQFESDSSKRSVYVPGKGFVFEDVSAGGSKEKTAESDTPTSEAGASVFDTKGKSAASSSNIFGHLSATPSEVEEDNDADDTEEASAAGDDQDEGSKNASLTPNSEKAATPALTANESSDDGDFTKALQKTKPADKATTNGPTESNAGGRSLFDRVQYDDEGNPKRHGEEEKLSTFFNSSKYASSFNSPAPSTPNPFGQPAKAQPDQVASPSSKPANPNPFGNLFGSSTNSSAPTPSIFGANNNGTPKPTNDQTWKMNSPIKFASDSTASSGPKIDFSASTSTSGQSKPLSNLFGGASSGSNSSTAGTSSATGFSFGDPSQKPASFLAPSTLSSAAPSRTPTPGVTTDTGAESGDGEAAESLPQVDLSRGGAGEENEDIVLELRARGLKLLPAGWESQGMGYVRILKDRTTSRGRILLRADPSGKVVLNASLMKQIKYNVSGNSVQFLVPQVEGAPQQWAVRVKKEEVQRLGSAIEETKS
ncbi:hypothetical protein P170DRAFT_136419 [Aspergillus steynii IBT 23096]|uniref:RanBD1 domain-containing protein n=1 Tax=Aspergillus steynii IBT 23096 TaxID=1392250 RepID=A0A2I2GB67_9EURO|nr:uncharacterized protein P170DRAFT_136419 [Aspergillus steynii IBT 23096]PLB50132.1 hypothetical protein P170DRAFT_136419 [Aspergillus steynii IBT 23096]